MMPPIGFLPQKTDERFYRVKVLKTSKLLYRVKARNGKEAENLALSLAEDGVQPDDVIDEEVKIYSYCEES